MKLDLLTDATVVGDAITFVSRHTNQKQQLQQRKDSIVQEKQKEEER